MRTTSRLEKVEKVLLPQDRDDGMCTCVPISTRVVRESPELDREGGTEAPMFCDKCGGERLTIRLCYVELPCPPYATIADISPAADERA